MTRRKAVRLRIKRNAWRRQRIKPLEYGIRSIRIWIGGVEVTQFADTTPNAMFYLPREKSR